MKHIYHKNSTNIVKLYFKVGSIACHLCSVWRASWPSSIFSYVILLRQIYNQILLRNTTSYKVIQGGISQQYQL